MERWSNGMVGRRNFLKTSSAMIAGVGIGASLAHLGTPRDTHAEHLTHASWVHGIAVLPLQNLSASRLGTEAQFTLGGWEGLWGFSFAIPTPVILYNQRLHLSAVMLKFSTTNGPTDLATVEGVSVFDGDLWLKHFSVNLAGVQDFVRLDVAEHYPVYLGLHLAVLVRVAVDIHAARISFIAAGADFV